VIEYAEWVVEYLVDNESVRFEARDEDDAREFCAKVNVGGFLPWRARAWGSAKSISSSVNLPAMGWTSQLSMTSAAFNNSSCPSCQLNPVGNDCLAIRSIERAI